ncbi:MULTISPECIES: hypothetical protein [unclassified Leptolyngbya]|uniref:hypothetical protein n=1 Tax=unclassified Leptolyngbya TaxID=2650499 RepID=UPI0016867D3D|nr:MULTISPECIES: hypothetical protein [unclassified Leptolyngbya]MBD1911518.1 hypothetical protein [Leptolyngbya sp. FACHB-8]MBD2155241.1 hypothetical protein [Leptolyngbya sp. FACHB-16]
MPEQERTIRLSEFSDEALLEICRAADVIACECPGYVARILRQVKAFRSYTLTCIDQFPEDTDTHQWLASQAQKVEEILWETMVDLMRKEKLIGESDEVLLDSLSERARAIALQQIGGSV